MPLLFQHTLPDCSLAVWKTDESVDELLNLLLPHQERYRQEITRFAATQRRREWLATRILLRLLLNNSSSEAEITHLPNGKPYLKESTVPISISHTMGYAALLIGHSGDETGIDIEQTGERVHRIAPRYMREDEPIHSYLGTDTWSLLLHWSAKETLFKCLNTPEVDFKQHLRIFPFIPAPEGSFPAEEYRTPAHRRLLIHYQLHPDFVLTWTTYHL
ncbi:MAG: 4'-phosphopantetheinyl transferase superfamily protein [Prevotellaceae bacterium]|jgi:4'-phosphopantetheinyl transferase EntD|nr:4'-phosphopantetheinyl transferase superfamily protein [Prevotellaceae bacterium]